MALALDFFLLILLHLYIIKKCIFSESTELVIRLFLKSNKNVFFLIFWRLICSLNKFIEIVLLLYFLLEEKVFPCLIFICIKSNFQSANTNPWYINVQVWSYKPVYLLQDKPQNISMLQQCILCFSSGLDKKIKFAKNINNFF